MSTYSIIICVVICSLVTISSAADPSPSSSSSSTPGSGYSAAPSQSSVDPFMMFLMLNGVKGKRQSFNDILMIMMMTGAMNMDPTTMILMLTMSQCEEPIEDCEKPNNDDKKLCGKPPFETAIQNAIDSNNLDVKPCCICPVQKGLFWSRELSSLNVINSRRIYQVFSISYSYIITQRNSFINFRY